ncbi:EscU/YscU/HrcU family type III secretion system export apparatus switch protein [Jannaschia sp. LMIT008]|uniref:EscU/YscU/HrcU family type III secretion system export apparatus switch protein n=1 Tax=Jannaschia maritima TaxID=3032585 RepID=UPI002811E231|nr:EscU/YscU/HrcU family type III secretion system export apparatus switch protein [Jannaschia sp. LMIT008]
MSAEEKDIAPSQRKLRQARQKGQAKQLRDLTTVAAFIAGIGGTAMAVPATVAAFGRGLDLGLAHLATPLSERDSLVAAASGIVNLARAEIASTLSLALGGIILTIVAVCIVAHGGVIFSLAPLAPKLSPLDPVAGFKRIFGLRSAIEFAKAFVKLVAAAAAFAYVAATFPAALVRLPDCGLGCALELGVLLVQIVLGAVLALALAFAVPDLRLQAWLFERDMRMTKTEQKQEMKDTGGNPQIKSAQKRLRQEAARSEGKRGPQAATVMVFGRGCAAGIRYVKGETPVPIVVAKSRDADHARALLDQAMAGGVRLYDSEKLTRRLVRNGVVGRQVPQDAFADVAAALSASGALTAGAAA